MPKIKFKRGAKANLPQLDEGEPGYTTDTKEFFIGSPSGNVQLAKNDDVKGIPDQIATLQTQVNGKASATDLAAKADKTSMGDLTTLQTTDKSSLVNAVNENTTQLAENKTQLDQNTAQLADRTNDLLGRGINVKYPPAPLVGAKGDGATDDTTAFQTIATNYPSSPIVIPDGDYILTNTISLNSNMIQGYGNARLVFDNPLGKDGLSFNPTVGNKVVGVKGLQVVCRISNGGSAIKTPLDSSEYTINYTKFEFEYLTIAGYTRPTTPLSFETVEAWAACLDIGDAWGVGIREVYGRGNYRIDLDVTGQFQCMFIKLHANNTQLTAHIDGFTCASMYRAIDLGDRTFFHILHGDITHSYDGIYESGTAIFSESRIKAVNVNAQRYGVFMKTGSNRQLDGITIRRHHFGIKTSTDSWYGIYYSGGSGVWITNCHAQPDESTGAFAGTQTAFYFDACNTGVFNGLIIGANCDVGIGLNNVTGNCIDNVVTWQNQVADKVYNLTANTRLSAFGKLTKVSSFVGTVFTKDGTIGTTNTQVSTVVV